MSPATGPGTTPGHTYEDTPMCGAITQHGTWGTAWVEGRQVMFMARPGQNFMCTNDSGHEGRHTACDGQGHVLAAWPRRDPEQYGHGRLHPEWS